MPLRLTTVVVAIIACSQPLIAQAGDNHVSLFRAHDAAIALGVIAAGAAVMSVDESIARSLQRPSTQSNTFLKGTSNVFSNLGFPGSAIISAGTYFVGLGTHSRPIAALGMHTGEAIVLGGVLAEGLQMTIGRSRPQRDITNARDFQFGKGFSSDDYTSLPSAHVTVAFAAATAASREVGRSWPGAARYVTPISYAAATLVGAARMYKNKHWASDVVGAAGLGTYSAVLFDRYNEGHPGNIFERVFLPSSIVPDAFENDLMVNSPDDARRAVRKLKAYGTDFVKIYATQDFVGDEFHVFMPNGKMVNSPSLTLGEIQAAVNEAHLAKPGCVRGGEIFLHDGGDLLGQEGVQIEDVLERDGNRLSVRSRLQGASVRFVLGRRAAALLVVPSHGAILVRNPP
jgi:membrane-associated phospholipid phosphatase